MLMLIVQTLQSKVSYSLDNAIKQSGKRTIGSIMTLKDRKFLEKIYKYRMIVHKKKMPVQFYEDIMMKLYKKIFI